MKMKELRVATGLSQEQFANAIHLSQATYSNYEIGKTQPPFDVLFDIADYYHVSLDYLLGREFGSELNNVYMSEQQKQLVKTILKLDTNACEKAQAYLSGLLDSQETFAKQTKTNIGA